MAVTVEKGVATVSYGPFSAVFVKDANGKIVDRGKYGFGGAPTKREMGIMRSQAKKALGTSKPTVKNKPLPFRITDVLRQEELPLQPPA